METDECKTCFFGKPEGNIVRCRRSPPSSDGNADNSIDYQPVMQYHDWCGEFITEKNYRLGAREMAKEAEKVMVAAMKKMEVAEKKMKAAEKKVVKKFQRQSLMSRVKNRIGVLWTTLTSKKGMAFPKSSVSQL